mgnify:CR=1 FL=1
MRVAGRLLLIRRQGKLSFGTLDKALFRKTGQPPGLPRLDLRLVDAGCRVVMPWAAPIGSARGIVNRDALKLLRDRWKNVRLLSTHSMTVPVMVRAFGPRRFRRAT